MRNPTNCFGIPDEHNGWTITQGPDDRFYATIERSAETWDDLRVALSPQTLPAPGDVELARHVRGIAQVIRAFPNDEAWGGPDMAQQAAAILDRAVEALATVAAANDEGVADDRGRVRQEAHVRGWRHGLEEAAKVADDLASVAERGKNHPQLLAIDTNEAWRRVEDACLDIAARIRSLATSRSQHEGAGR